MTALQLPLSRRSTAARLALPAPWLPTLLTDVAVLVGCARVLGGLAGIVYALGVVAALAALRAYRRRLGSSVGAVLGHLVVAACLPAVAIGVVLAPADASRLLRAVPAVLALLVVGRIVAAAASSFLAARAVTMEPAVIIGAGPLAVRLAQDLEARPELGIRPVGFLDDVDDHLPLPVLGGVAQLAQVLERTGARHVVVAYGRAREPEVVAAVRAARAADVDIWVVPRLFDLGAGPAATGDQVHGTPLTRLHRGAHAAPAWTLKRVFDVAVSGALLVMVSPLLAAIALAVRLSSPGPILFRQHRVGQDGRAVEVLKFRTLRVNDDAATTWNVTEDDRVTAVGRILRPTSLDELPQLLNVLRGDMSLVGPRPERPHFVELFAESVPGYADRHRVPVGLTGLAQVNGLRGDTSIEDRARFDNRYIEGWSLWGDVLILLRTIRSVVRPPASVRIQAPPAAVEPADEPVLDLRDAVAVADVAPQPTPA